MNRNGNDLRGGFSLIEIAVVLIVIGLVVGGIYAGQTMIRSSQLQSIIADQGKYVEAAGQFREKYGYLPGDFPNATSSWGAMTTCPPTAGTSNTGILTCNGNGDSQVNFQTGSSNTTNLNEAFLFWQHLANEKLIEGKYTGVAGSPGNSDHVPGSNSPESRLSHVGFGIAYAGTIVAGKDISGNNVNYFNNALGHVFIVGKYSSGNLPVASALTPSDALNLDTKYDDGAPGTGNVQTWANASAYNANCSGASSYNVSVSGPQCSLVLLTGF